MFILWPFLHFSDFYTYYKLISDLYKWIKQFRLGCLDCLTPAPPPTRTLLEEVNTVRPELRTVSWGQRSQVTTALRPGVLVSSPQGSTAVPPTPAQIIWTHQIHYHTSTCGQVGRGRTQQRGWPRHHGWQPVVQRLQQRLQQLWGAQVVQRMSTLTQVISLIFPHKTVLVVDRQQRSTERNIINVPFSHFIMFFYIWMTSQTSTIWCKYDLNSCPHTLEHFHWCSIRLSTKMMVRRSFVGSFQERNCWIFFFFQF